METTAITSSIIPIAAAAGTLAVGAWWAALVPRLALGFLCASLVSGQLRRLPLPGQGGGLLVSDIAVVGVLWAAIWQYGRRKQVNIHVKRLVVLIGVFLGWSLFTLVVHASDLMFREFAVAGLYWVRLATHLLLLPALLILTSDHVHRKKLKQWFVASVVLLLMLGFFQLIFIPRLADIAVLGVPSSILQRAGWDPHIGRMVSTWLDPNFFGGLIIVSVPVIGIFVSSRVRAATLVALLLVALAYTQSRSALIGLVGSGVLGTFLAWFKYPQRLSVHRGVQIGVLVSVVIMWAVLAAVLLGDRFTNVFEYDPTVELRRESLRVVWGQLLVPNAVIGIGYNTYQFAAQEVGLISSFATHSRAGADNSFLTIWVTTGIVGLALYLSIWGYISNILIALWIRRNSLLSFAVALSIVALTIHSQFVNSFLYSHLIIVLMIICALALSDQEEAAV